MKKKIMAMLLAFCLLFGMTTTAFATGGSDDGSVTVTFTITKGSEFYTTNEGAPIIMKELTVPYFDLELYGLEAYYYNPDCYTSANPGEIFMNGVAGTKETAEGHVTMLHAIIYATEVFQAGIPEAEAGQGALYETGSFGNYLAFTGSVGSIYNTNFWGEGANLNYYLNYEYPLAMAGLGSTSDQTLVEDGDHISIHKIVDDTGLIYGSSFGYFEADGITNFATVKKGDQVTLNLLHTIKDYSGSSTATMNATDIPVHYTASPTASATDWTSLGYTDGDGNITVDTSTWSAGTYYIGTDSTNVYIGDSTQAAPAVFVLTVEEEAVKVTYGDVNGDSNINAGDAALILRYATDIISEDVLDIVAADVNADGSVNASDAALVLRYAAELITAFPAESAE